MTDQPNPPEYKPDQAGLPQTPKKRSSNTATILIIIAGVLVFFCCMVPIIIIVVLALLGPSIGNVFSEIIDQLEATPTPGLIPLIGLLTKSAVLW